MTAGSHLLPARPSFIELVGRGGKLAGVKKILEGDIPQDILESQYEYDLLQSMVSLETNTPFPLSKAVSPPQNFVACLRQQKKPPRRLRRVFMLDITKQE